MLCSSCGQDNPWDAKVCVHCGQPINPAPASEQAADAAAAVTEAYTEPANADGSGTSGMPPTGPGIPCYGAPGMVMPPGGIKPVRDYMSWSIITTILSVITCNLLAAGLGIPAIVFSSQGRDKKAMGDEYGAYLAQKNAQVFFWISFGFCALGVLFWFFYVGIIALSFLGIILTGM